eukprot:TRINITY_DN49903_c0_g1_i1.p1 TRINITY_DN49903_c0_g1~~TRINITY_DN49903_c0_g1_i1.p1  ORF type:complete len:268 (+),score=141.07 TRINITY_DN49903_c0_g1_i1:78-806(+)
MADLVGRCQRKLDELTDAIRKLDEFANLIGKPQDNAALRTKTDKAADRCSALKVELNAMLKEMKGDADLTAEYKDMAKQLSKLTGQFTKLNKRVAEAKKEHGAPAAEAAAPAADAELDSGSGGRQQQMQFDTRAMKRVNVDVLHHEEALQREKAAEIRAIEDGVQDVHECYQQLNDLVKEQQEGIDVAETNVAQTRVDVQKGTTDIHKAGEYQKSSRKKLFCICFLVIVICGILAVVIAVAS